MIKVIDSQVFANEGGSLQGELPVAALTRLLDLLAASDGFLKYRIKGQMGPYNRPQFLVEIDGVMSLCCQR
ncbi:MAG TPA: DNA-binding protein, partial [Accumulibacter sp.]|nr:DNA-binding protein [Accumulibacter sp.]